MTTSSSVEKLLLAMDADNATYLDFKPSISRERAAKVIEAILWLYSARSGSAASVYSSVSLWDALGVDRHSLNFRSQTAADDEIGNSGGPSRE